jgi:hypothetical protein
MHGTTELIRMCELHTGYHYAISFEGLNITCASRVLLWLGLRWQTPQI